MGRYATRKTLKGYCAQAGVTLYKHRLDGASYQYCAGGYTKRKCPTAISSRTMP